MQQLILSLFPYIFNIKLGKRDCRKSAAGNLISVLFQIPQLEAKAENLEEGRDSIGVSLIINIFWFTFDSLGLILPSARAAA